MGLLKKMTESKEWWKGFGKKATGVAVVSSIALGAMFGGASYMKLKELEKEQSEAKAVDMQETVKEKEYIKDIVVSLNSVASKVGDDEVLKQLELIEQKLNEVENDNESLKSIVAELKPLIEELQSKLESIENRLDKLENKKEEVVGLTSAIARAKAILVIVETLENNYMHYEYAESNANVMIAPSGDYVGTDGEGYQYCIAEDQVVFTNFGGEESFGYIQGEGNLKNIICEMLDREDDKYADFDEANSTENKYVFKSEYYDATVTITFESGKLLELVTSNGYSLTPSTQEEYESMLSETKEHLKMIGVFDSLKKELEASLSHKYKGITSQNNIVGNGSGVFSGEFAASETKFKNGSTVYSLQTEEEQYDCRFDENGEFEKEWKYDGEPYDVTQAFKNEILMKGKTDSCTIKFNEKTGTYIIESKNDRENGINITTEVKFNDDLSVEIKQTWDHNKDDIETEVITCKIEKITKAQFEKIYNRIYNMCEQAKEKSDGVTQ